MHWMREQKMRVLCCLRERWTRKGMCVCPKACIKIDSPVCGSDETTYLNECEMRIEACRKAQYVMMISRGSLR
ncbi:hypothetical protein CEXT_776861 [Caerostris extrusa]|uniref:Kazal-like domain-containing protein n=1 Tax=Caerostris extrusa TaxID=172846 RepID=A0AAV4TM54_CAEEX|nr:hypothetical protein CEXT_776861 [Caerostris extrusa]